MEARACPWRLARELGAEDLPALAAAVRGGALPYAGGLLEQPVRVIEAINLYSVETKRAEDADATG